MQPRRKILLENLNRCVGEFDDEIEIEIINELPGRFFSEFTVLMRFHSKVLNHHAGVVSPTFNARCDWLGNSDVDLYEVASWLPLTKGTLFAWWWHHLAITEIEFSRDEPKWINKLKEKEADRILKARGIKAEHE